MTDEFIHWPNPHLLLSATCDEILSWTTKFFMKHYLVSNYIATLYFYNPPNVLQGSTYNVGIAVSVGVTRYHIYYSIGPLSNTVPKSTTLLPKLSPSPSTLTPCNQQEFALVHVVLLPWPCTLPG